MRILHVIPHLDYCGPAKQLVLLATELARERLDQRICVLGHDSPWARGLRAVGLPVDVLTWARGFEISPLWRLRRLIQTLQPDITHAWGLSPLRVLALA